MLKRSLLCIMSVLAINKANGHPAKVRVLNSHMLVRFAERFFGATLLAASIVVPAMPVATEPPIVPRILGMKAQEIVNQLRSTMSVDNDVAVVVVSYHPLVFSVEPMDKAKTHFLLSMELGFLQTLDDDELRAALAHEMGHVTVYTHHPFLQTERLANDIGQNVAKREAFESMYKKLWMYEGTTGVPFEQLLGPSRDGALN